MSTWVLLATAGWALLLLISSGVVLNSRRWREMRYPLVGIIILALFARLAPSLLLARAPASVNYDLASYQLVGQAGLDAQDIYIQPGLENRHPYLPFFLYWLIFSEWASQVTGQPFAFMVRLAPIAADTLLAVVIYLWARRGMWGKGAQAIEEADAQRSGLAYALNPVAVFVCAYQGQFDSIPVLFTLLALWSGAGVATGAWLGAGILVKSWPVLAFPVLFVGARTWAQKGWLLLGTAALPILGLATYCLWFQADWTIVLGRALGYNHGIGVYGYTYLVRLGTVWQVFPQVVFDFLVSHARWITLAGLAGIWFSQVRRQRCSSSPDILSQSPLDNFLTILVAFFALTHAFSIQYLMWVLPFALASHQFRWIWRYTLAAFGYMFLAYNTLILDFRIEYLLPWPQADLALIIPASLPVWVVVWFWLVERLGWKSRLAAHSRMKA